MEIENKDKTMSLLSYKLPFALYFFCCFLFLLPDLAFLCNVSQLTNAWNSQTAETDSVMGLRKHRRNVTKFLSPHGY